MKKLFAIFETLGAPNPQRSSAMWQGMYGPSLPASLDHASWPYRTQTAELVWEKIKGLIPKHPEMSEQEVIELAVLETEVDSLDLSPEDWRLLEMATEWFKNGYAAQRNPTQRQIPIGPYASRNVAQYTLKRGIY